MDGESISNVYPLMFHDRVPSLQQRANTMFSVFLWQHAIANGVVTNLRDSSVVVQEFLRVPRIVRDSTRKSVELIRKALDKWSYHYMCYISVDRPTDDTKLHAVSKHFDDLTWRFDGSIDWDATAKKMMAGDELDLLCKYRLACLYCMENEVKRIWPMLNESVRSSYCHEQLLSYYWEHHMKRGFDSFPSYNSQSILYRIVIYGNVESWSAVEYLWNRVAARDRLQEASFLLQHRGDFCAKYILQKMTAKELENIFTTPTLPSSVMCSLASVGRWSDFTIFTWKYLRHIITPAQYVGMLHALFRILDEDGHVADLLYEIWISSPANLKDYLRQNHLESIVDEFSSRSDSYYFVFPRDVRFIIEVFSGNDVKKNELAWKRSWKYLLAKTAIDDLLKIMRLCFQDDLEIAQFKNSTLMKVENIRRRCGDLIANGLYNDLFAFMRFCCDDEKTINSMIEEILYWAHPRFYADSVEVRNAGGNNFYKFLNTFFPKVEDRTEFKISYIRSPRTSVYLHDLIDQRDFEVITYIVDEFASNDDIAREIKKGFFDHNQLLFANGILIEELGKWKNFYIWCCKDEDDLMDFKSKISIDDLMRVFFEFIRVHRQFFDNELRGDIDEFLMWYFESKEKLKEYKLAKVYAYKQCKIFSSVLRMRSKSIIGDLLKWFFDGDVGKIEEFRVHVKKDGVLEEHSDDEDEECDESDLSNFFE